MIENLLTRCDTLIIGGGMANTFLAAKGYNMQDSLVEAGSVATAKAIMAKAGDRLMLPVDAVAADRFDAAAASQVVDLDKVPAGWRAGHRAQEHRAVRRGAQARQAGGVERPDGRVRVPGLRRGPFALARLLATTGATTVIGGGDSASAVKKAGVAKQMTHVSTGGGASLEWKAGCCQGWRHSTTSDS